MLKLIYCIVSRMCITWHLLKFAGFQKKFFKLNVATQEVIWNIGGKWNPLILMSMERIWRLPTISLGIYKTGKNSAFGNLISHLYCLILYRHKGSTTWSSCNSLDCQPPGLWFNPWPVNLNWREIHLCY